MDCTIDNIKSVVIREISSAMVVDDSYINIDTSIRSLGADSFNMIEIALGIEDYFNIFIEDEMLDKFDTPKEIIDWLDKRLNR